MTRVRQRMHQLNREILESRQLLSTLDVVNSSSGKVLAEATSALNNRIPIVLNPANFSASQSSNLAPQNVANIINESSGK